ncbi:MAG: hypothetical protein ACUVT9_06625, partial [Candidatus Bathycorpusculaceae bacterium]
MKVVLHDELKYPYLGKDAHGFVLHLIKPRRLDKNHVFFQGLKFNLQDSVHKKIIWYLFKASVYHLSLHARLSNFSIYSKWARGKQLNLSVYVLSLIEDAIIAAHLRKAFPWMLPEVAYANAFSFLRMKDAEELSNDMSRIMVSALLSFHVGEVKGAISDEIKTDIEAITSILRKLSDNPTIDERIGAANKIYESVAVYG